jgi:hypothetical protein
VRWRRQALAKGFVTWSENAWECGRKRRVLSRVVGRLTHQTQARAFDLWHGNVLGHRQLLQKMRRAAVKWRMRAVSRCVETWSQGVVCRRVFSRQHAKLQARLTARRLRACLQGWASQTSHLDRRRRLLLGACGRHIGECRRRAFLVWQQAVSARVGLAGRQALEDHLCVPVSFCVCVCVCVSVSVPVSVSVSVSVRLLLISPVFTSGKLSRITGSSIPPSAGRK